eukprot:scaffold130841_cov25-Cyclotella_meneghiniana.AAC.1
MQLNLNRSGCPSLVSLGRTTIWAERKTDDIQHTIDLKPRVGRFPDTPKDVLQPSMHNLFNPEDRTDDALDAIRSLDFLFGGTITSSDKLSTKTEQSVDEDKVEIEESDGPNNDNTTKRIKTTQPL